MDVDMNKKLTMLAVTLGALLALAAPTMAQADQLLEGGIEVTSGSEITLTSTNFVMTSPIGTIICVAVTVHEEVTANGPTTITGKEKSTTVKECNHAITDPTVGSVDLGSGVGKTTSSKLVVDGICTYTGSIPFSYVTNSSTVTITGKEQLTGSPSFPCGKATVTGNFSLETSSGVAITIS